MYAYVVDITVTVEYLSLIVDFPILRMIFGIKVPKKKFSFSRENCRTLIVKFETLEKMCISGGLLYTSFRTFLPFSLLSSFDLYKSKMTLNV